MLVHLNGTSHELEAGATVAMVMDRLEIGADSRGVAVALDGEVVPRSAWTQTELAEGARLEVVVAVQGG